MKRVVDMIDWLKQDIFTYFRAKLDNKQLEVTTLT